MPRFDWTISSKLLLCYLMCDAVKLQDLQNFKPPVGGASAVGDSNVANKQLNVNVTFYS